MSTRAALIVFATLLAAGCNKEGSAESRSAGPVPKAGVAVEDWTKKVVTTPEGGYRMGNPDAKVKLVEFASFTCSHCQEFHKQSAALKKSYVKSGQVSLEYRPFILNPWDLMAASLAKCEGPDRFFVWADQLYGNQTAWVKGIQEIDPAKMAELQTQPRERQLFTAAQAAGFDAFARQRGLPSAKFEKCLTDMKGFEALTAQTNSATEVHKVAGTPTFLMNGKKIEGTTWAQIEPQIKSAL